MKRYVLGFLFSGDREAIVLIKKKRPDWQKGMWNGIGGHIEKDETPIDAFIREFKEETGVSIPINKVYRFGVMKFKEAEIHLFKAFDTNLLCNVKTTTDESVRIFYLRENKYRKHIPNLSWLIPMALDDAVEYSEINH